MKFTVKNTKLTVEGDFELDFENSLVAKSESGARILEGLAPIIIRVADRYMDSKEKKPTDAPAGGPAGAAAQPAGAKKKPGRKK